MASTTTSRRGRILTITLCTAFVTVVPNSINSISSVSAAAPKPVSAATWPNTVDKSLTRIQLQMGYSMLSSSPPDLSSFDLRFDGVVVPVTKIDYSIPLFLYLEYATPPFAGQVITLSYTAPAVVDNTPDNAALQRVGGEDTESFTVSVTNLSKIPRPSQSDGSSGGNTSGGSLSDGTNGPRWDIEPTTESEFDTNTEGYMPTVIPGEIIITNEAGFVIDKNNGIKPKIRSKNYSGKIKMSISSTYKDGAATKKYKCNFAPFGNSRKVKTAAWRWHTPKKACVLPKPLVAALQNGSTVLSAKGKWARQWTTSGSKSRPDKSKIKPRKLKYTVRAKPKSV